MGLEQTGTILDSKPLYHTLTTVTCDDVETFYPLFVAVDQQIVLHRNASPFSYQRMPELTKNSSVIVIGGGAWGTSVALALGRAGYSSVTVVDPHPVPSPLSAATDVNKIVDGGMCAL